MRSSSICALTQLKASDAGASPTCRTFKKLDEYGGERGADRLHLGQDVDAVEGRARFDCGQSGKDISGAL
jgi:hypothetical protein